MKKTRVLDMSSWWRRGGADWAVIKREFDGVILRAGVGIKMDVLLPEFVDACRDHGIPYATYHIPARPSWTGLSASDQALQYQDWYGVRDAVCVGDIEPPISGRYDLMVTSSQVAEYMRTIDAVHQYAPMWYSNKNCLDRLSWPAVLRDYWGVAATYYWDAHGKPYRDYESFQAAVFGNYPYWVPGTIYQDCIVLWQFTDYGDPDKYGATIKRQVDLNLGTVDHVFTMQALFPTGMPIPPEPPEPEPEIMRYRIIEPRGLNARTSPEVRTGNLVATMPYQYEFDGTGRTHAKKGIEFWIEWVHPSHGTVWSAAVYGSTRYLETL